MASSAEGGAISGAVGGLGASVAMKGLGEGFQALRTSVRPGEVPLAVPATTVLEHAAGGAEDAGRLVTDEAAAAGTLEVASEGVHVGSMDATKVAASTVVDGAHVDVAAHLETPHVEAPHIETPHVETPHVEAVPGAGDHLPEVKAVDAVTSPEVQPRPYTVRRVGGEDVYDPRIHETIDINDKKISYGWEDHDGNWRPNKVIDQSNGTTFERVPGTDNQLKVTDASGQRVITADIDVKNNGNYEIRNESVDPSQSWTKPYTGPGGEKWQPEAGSTLERNRIKGDVWTSPSGEQTWVDGKGIIWHQTAEGDGHWLSAQGKFTESDLGGARWDWNDGRSEIITFEGMGGVHDPKTMAPGEFRTADGGVFTEPAALKPGEIPIPKNFADAPSTKYPADYFQPPKDAVHVGKENGFDVYRGPDGTQYLTSGQDVTAASAIRKAPDGTTVWKDNLNRVWENAGDKDHPLRWQNENGTYESSFETKGQRWTWKDGSADWLDNNKNLWHHDAGMPEGEWHGANGAVMKEGTGKYEFRFVGDKTPFTIPTVGLAGVVGASQVNAQGGDGAKPDVGVKSVDHSPTEVQVSDGHGGQRTINLDSDGMYRDASGTERKFYSKDDLQEIFEKNQTHSPDGYGQFGPSDNPGLMVGHKADYQVRLEQVNAADHPQGLDLSTKEARIVTSKPLTINTDKGPVELPEGYKLPIGTQIDKASGSIVTPAEGVRLDDGQILHTQAADMTRLSGGQHLSPGDA